MLIMVLGVKQQTIRSEQTYAQRTAPHIPASNTAGLSGPTAKVTRPIVSYSQIAQESFSVKKVPNPDPASETLAHAPTASRQTMMMESLNSPSSDAASNSGTKEESESSQSLESHETTSSTPSYKARGYVGQRDVSQLPLNGSSAPNNRSGAEIAAPVTKSKPSVDGDAQVNTDFNFATVQQYLQRGWLQAGERSKAGNMKVYKPSTSDWTSSKVPTGPHNVWKSKGHTRGTNLLNELWRNVNSENPTSVSKKTAHK